MKFTLWLFLSSAIWVGCLSHSVQNGDRNPKEDEAIVRARAIDRLIDELNLKYSEYFWGIGFGYSVNTEEDAKMQAELLALKELAESIKITVSALTEHYASEINSKSVEVWRDSFKGISFVHIHKADYQKFAQWRDSCGTYHYVCVAIKKMKEYFEDYTTIKDELGWMDREMLDMVKGFRNSSGYRDQIRKKIHSDTIRGLPWKE